MKKGSKRVLVDAREFVFTRYTGIRRVLEGLTESLVESPFIESVILATHKVGAVPSRLKDLEKIRVREIPGDFIKSEKALSVLTREAFDVYLSPYPKLPLFGCYCEAVHIIHDVLDLTHSAYRRRLKVIFDIYRVRKALKKAALTWYDSIWSMEETKKLTGFAGINPRVRNPGIDERFNNQRKDNEKQILEKHKLQGGYIVIIGNGSPHKNLGVILRIRNRVQRQIVFVGVPAINQGYWKSRYPDIKAVWIENVADEDLPGILRNAFCLAQPSAVEGYGYPPLEAMACGTPAVVSSIPVLIETTGGQALGSDPSEPEEWITAFESLEDEYLYTKQVEKGLKWARPLRGNRGWKNHVSDMEELIGMKSEDYSRKGI